MVFREEDPPSLRGKGRQREWTRSGRGGSERSRRGRGGRSGEARPRRGGGRGPPPGAPTSASQSRLPTLGPPLRAPLGPPRSARRWRPVTRPYRLPHTRGSRFPAAVVRSPASAAGRDERPQTGRRGGRRPPRPRTYLFIHRSAPPYLRPTGPLDPHRNAQASRPWRWGRGGR